MARVSFEEVEKCYGEVQALSRFTVDIGDGECVAVLGPSGCGKSTLLRVTAGLEQLSGGRICLDGDRIDHLPPQSRDVAMVFQSYALYPHLSVRGNIEFPLRMRKLAAESRAPRVAEVAAMLELDSLLERRPAELSGGQRQRVALARALVRKPRLFLLDEPLSNLDARLRTSVRQHIRTLQRRLRVTTLYVTHDQVEALTLGDRVIVLRDGEIQQIDTPSRLYECPATTFVAAFIGSPPMNLVRARRDGSDARIGDVTLPISEAVQGELEAAGAVDVIVGIRAESLLPPSGDTAAGPRLRVDRDSAEVIGGDTIVQCRMGDQTIAARVPTGEVPEALQLPPAALHWFASESGRRLGP